MTNEEQISDWAKETKQEPLTRTQYNFLLWMLKEDNKQQICQIGNLDNIFISFRQYLKK